MSELLVLAGCFVFVAGLVHHGFHSWLKQRELERLSATDKAQLLKKFEEVDSKLLELKNSALNNRR